MRTRRPATIAAAAFIAIAAPLSLSGCFPAPEDIIGGFVEGGIESVTGGDIATGSLPKDFPSEIPLAEGEIQLGLTVPVDGGKSGWSVTIETSADTAAIAAQLAAAGYAPADGDSSALLDTAEGSFITATNGTWTVAVIVVAADGGSGNVANYIVAPANCPRTPLPAARQTPKRDS